jgi:hypothetical protein
MPSLSSDAIAIMAASSRPRRSSSATSLEFWPISSTRTPGCRASTSATSPAPAYSRAVPNIPNRIVPVSNDFSACAARRVSSAAARVFSACGRRVSATVVGTTPRPTRRNSCTPSDFSRARICSDTEGWAYPSSSAARVSDPCS